MPAPTLIPPYLGNEVKSPAEVKVFDILKGLNLPNSYIFHSLGLPDHKSKNYGESDFVLVCPLGICCFEVKGGRLAFENGKWVYINRYGEENIKDEGPFEQAKGNMYSLMTELNQEFNLDFSRNILFAFGVILPDIEFNVVSAEITNELVYDLRTKDVTQYVSQVFGWWQGRPNNSKCKRLTQEQINQIVNILRPSFNFIPNLADELSETEKRLMNLTREQSKILDCLSANERLIIKGSAGTGKTLLASHCAQSSTDQGKKVLLLSFNKNLAGTVSRHVLGKNAEDQNLQIINIHAFFGQYVETKSEEIEKNPQEYFNSTLPSLFCQYIKNLNEEESQKFMFDLIVMDEAQDFLRTENLAALDMILKGGLEKGRWICFYDENQNIYNPQFEEGFELLNSYNAAKFSLSTNCRNTVQIGRFSSRESGIEISSFLLEEGEAVRQIQYKSDKELEESVRKILGELRNDKVLMKDITFLSPKNYKNSALSRLGIKVNELGANYQPDSPNPRFSTIQGFKGLDSKIIILLELHHISKKNFSRYVYIATTRARTLLYVLNKNIEKTTT